MYQLIVKGGTVIPSKGCTRADITADNGIIVKVEEEIGEPAERVLDANCWTPPPGSFC